MLLATREEEELDMLDAASAAAARQGDPNPQAYLEEESRLACQLILRPGDGGLVVRLPEDVTNMLEVPLWMRPLR